MEKIKKRNVIIIAVLIAILVITAVALIIILKDSGSDGKGAGPGGNPTSFTVTIDAMNGTEAEQKTVNKNNKIANPGIVERNGYFFDGWYSGDKVYNFNTPVTKNITIYAKWDAIYTVSGSGITGLTLRGKTLSVLDIPDMIDGVVIDRIYSWAFSGVSTIEDISIPDTIKSLGNNAFDGTSWYDQQSDGVVYVGNILYTYKGSMPANTTIFVRANTYAISSMAFYGQINLVDIRIPDSVYSIGSYVFNDTAWYNSQPNGLVYAGKVIYEYKGTATLENVIIGNDITGIAEYAFYNKSSIKTVMISSSVKYVGLYAFMNCGSLAQYEVASGNTYLSSENGVLFNNSKSLLIHYPEGKNDLEYSIPDTVKTLEFSSFFGNNYIENIIIPNGVECIGTAAFRMCSKITELYFPASVISIGASSFSSCIKLISIIMNENNPIYKTVDNVLFSKDMTVLYTYLQNKIETSYIIPESVIHIGDSAFGDCPNLINITLPSKLKTIEGMAFWACKKINEIRVPASVEWIGNNAFQMCNSLQRLIIESVFPPAVGVDLFVYISGGRIPSIQVPAVSVESYKIAKGFIPYASKIEAITE